MEHAEQTSRGIAAVVSQRIAASGLSRREIANETGIPLTTLTRRLMGTSPFLVTELAALASVLQTTVKNLVADAERDAA